MTPTAPNQPDELEFLRGALRQLMRSDPFQRFIAHGVDVGPKMVRGTPTGELAIRFYVACKLPRSGIPASRRVPPEMRFVSTVDGVERVARTDVIEAPLGELLALPPGAMHRPTPGGVRLSVPANDSAGTMGGWVWDKTDSSIVLLSNEHVLGSVPGAVVFQPSNSVPDGGLGVVKRSGMLAAGPTPTTPEECYNFVDAAVASADTSDNFDLTVLDVGPAVYVAEHAAGGMAVEKFGQMTQHTKGVVTSVDYNTSFDFPGIGQVVLCDLMRIVPEDGATNFSSKGDSGSIVFKQDSGSAIKPAVGLLFAGGGSGASNWAAACKMSRVFDVLDLDVLCAGGFPAFLDALFAADAPDPGAVAAVHLFRPSRARDSSTELFHAGLARAVQSRLRATARGGALVEVVERRRADLMMLLVRNGDIRRATVAALRPILRGAATTDALFSRRLTTEDVGRLTDLLQVVERHASDALRTDVAAFRPLLRGAAGKRIDQIVEGARKGKGSDGA